MPLDFRGKIPRVKKDRGQPEGVGKILQARGWGVVGTIAGGEEKVFF